MECPKCGTETWASTEKHSLQLKSDGTVRVAKGNRWGQKVKMICNNYDCDVVVNMYLDMELEPDKLGDTEPTGAEVIAEKIGSIDVEKRCENCNKKFVSSVFAEVSRRGKLKLSGNEKCSDCDKFHGIVKVTLQEVEPELLKD